MVVGTFGGWTVSSVGGWVGGSGSFCMRGVFSCLWEAAMFLSSLYRPALAKFKYEPTHLFATVRIGVLL